MAWSRRIVARLMCFIKYMNTWVCVHTYSVSFMLPFIDFFNLRKPQNSYKLHYYQCKTPWN